MSEEIKVIDTATDFIRETGKAFPKYLSRGLKSLGWFMQQQIKKGIRSGAPGGRKYTQTMNDTARKSIEKSFGNELQSRYPFLGKLVQAVGYDKSTVDKGHIVVGWLSNSAVDIGTKQELGYTKHVSNRMRVKFAAADDPIKPISENKTELTVPKRPTFDPMMAVLEPQSVPYLEKKLWEYIENPNMITSKQKTRRPRGVAPAKKYRVYG